MKRNENDIDRIVQDALGSYKPEVPPHIWDRIRQKEDRRRPVGFWFFLSGHRMIRWGILLLIAGCGAYFLYPDRTSLPRSTSARVDASPSSVSSTSIQPESPPEKRIANPSAEASQQEVSVKTLSTAIAVPNPSDARIPSQTTQAVEPNIPAARLSPNPAQSGSADAEEAVDTHNRTRPLQKSLASRKRMNLRTAATAEESTEAFTAGEKQSPDEAVLRTPSERLAQHIDRDPSLKLPALIRKTIPPVAQPDPRPRKEKKAIQQFVEVYAGPDLVLSDLRDTDGSAYLQRRQETTTQQLSLSGGIRYVRVFSNGLSLRAGLQLSQINETFRFVQGDLLQTVFVTDARGDTIGSYATSYTRFKTHSNRYRMLDIPLMAGYEWGGELWRWNLSAGAVFNLRQWNRGVVLNDALQPVNMDSDSASAFVFRNRTGYSAVISFSALAQLRPGLSLLIEPYFRYGLSNLNKPDITLRQRFHTTGIRLGLRWKLSRNPR